MKRPGPTRSQNRARNSAGHGAPSSAATLKGGDTTTLGKDCTLPEPLLAMLPVSGVKAMTMRCRQYGMFHQVVRWGTPAVRAISFTRCACFDHGIRRRCGKIGKVVPILLCNFIFAAQVHCQPSCIGWNRSAVRFPL